jgi:hypothetical protein
MDLYTSVRNSGILHQSRILVSSNASQTFQN